MQTRRHVRVIINLRSAKRDAHSAAAVIIVTQLPQADRLGPMAFVVGSMRKLISVTSSRKKRAQIEYFTKNASNSLTLTRRAFQL